MEGKIVFVDDHALILKSQQRMAQSQPEWLCHFYDNAPEALSFLAVNDCDIERER